MPTPIHLDSLDRSQRCRIRTKHTTYTVSRLFGLLHVVGHHRYCPTERILILPHSDIVTVGETWLFATREHPEPIETSVVQSIEV